MKSLLKEHAIAGASGEILLGKWMICSMHQTDAQYAAYFKSERETDYLGLFINMHDYSIIDSSINKGTFTAVPAEKMFSTIKRAIAKRKGGIWLSYTYDSDEDICFDSEGTIVYKQGVVL